MIVILKINANEPADPVCGWMFGSDTHDLRRQCEGAWDDDIRELAPILYRIEFPTKGKHKLAPNFIMLVG